ncbi:MAG: tRNA pseudouridine(55) synthase TruB [Acidobacteria bacterium]|nr:tRNA pseudouridine(55) synthase TruB [Acidobacteriota bacterium]
MTNPKSTIQNPTSPDGVLIVDKPADWTSHDVVAKVRKILRTRRVGHTGTLDPFATGVLVVCVNRATRLVQYLTGDDKEYVATMRLGFATDTGDFTGQMLSPVTDASHITPEQVQTVLKQLQGRIRQIPPMYSAKKVGGVRLHELARRGEEVERQAIEVEIKELELLSDSHAESVRPQEFSFRVVCSAGTYVRTLAEDLGKRLGVGAHLTALRRTRAGSCRLTEALTLETLSELVVQGKIDDVLISMADAVDLPEVLLSEEECKAIRHGRSIRRTEIWDSGALAKLCDAERNLLAIAEFDSTKSGWQPRAVLVE